MAFQTLLSLAVSLRIIIIFLLSLILILILTHGFLPRIRNKRKAITLGCGSIPLEPTRYPLGIDVVLALIKADREERFPDFAIERFRRMGCNTWRTSNLGSEFFVTSEPENLKAILATQFKDFRMGAARRGNFLPIFGKSIFAVDGPAWLHARDIIRPQFSRGNVSDLGLEERHWKKMLLALEFPANSNGWSKEVSLIKLFFRLTMDTATEFFFGESVDCQLEKLREEREAAAIVAAGGVPPKEKHDFSWSFDHGQEWLNKRLRFRKFYWLVGGKAFNECVDVMHGFVDGMVAKAFKDLEMRKKDLALELDEANTGDGSHHRRQADFIEELSTRTGDPVEIRDHLLGLLMAGRDTTASMLGWVLYCLVRDQRVFDKLRAIILDTFGPYSSTDTSRITFESLKSCTYLQHVLNETQRMHAVVPFNSRTSVVDTTLPVGGGPDEQQPVFVPAGTEVNFVVHVTHRRKDIWGPDADEFKPERWETKKTGWHFTPFSGGPRICLGQQFALTEVGYVTVRMLQYFDSIEGVDVDRARDWHYMRLSCAPGPGANGVRVRLHRANEGQVY